MEVERVSDKEVVFTLLYPSIMCTVEPTSLVGGVLKADIGGDVAVEIRDMEKRMIVDLRECSQRAFTSFKDEYEQMFRSCIRKTSVSMRLHADSSGLQVGTPADVSMRPVEIKVKAGRAIVLWDVSCVEDPTPDPPPAALQAPGPAAKRSSAQLVKLRRVMGELQKVEQELQAGDGLSARSAQVLSHHRIGLNRTQHAPKSNADMVRNVNGRGGNQNTHGAGDRAERAGAGPVERGT